MHLNLVSDRTNSSINNVNLGIDFLFCMYPAKKLPIQKYIILNYILQLQEFPFMFCLKGTICVIVTRGWSCVIVSPAILVLATSKVLYRTTFHIFDCIYFLYKDESISPFLFIRKTVFSNNKICRGLQNRSDISLLLPNVSSLS